MIIFLYGPDAYKRQDDLKKIVAVYRQKHSNLNLDFFDLASDESVGRAGQNSADGKEINKEKAGEEFLKLKDFLSNQSLFDDFKLAVIYNFYGAKTNKNLIALVKSFLEIPKTTLIIAESQAPLKDFTWLLKKPVQARESPELKGAAFKSFLRQEAKRLKLNFSASAENFLTRIFEPDTWALVNELEKICLAELKAPIEIEDIKPLGEFNLKENIYDLARLLAVPRQSLKVKLANLERLFLQKFASAHIFNLLAAIASRSFIEKLADYDVSIKSGGLEYEEALLDLVIS